MRRQALRAAASTLPVRTPTPYTRPDMLLLPLMTLPPDPYGQHPRLLQTVIVAVEEEEAGEEQRACPTWSFRR